MQRSTQQVRFLAFAVCYRPSVCLSVVCNVRAPSVAPLWLVTSGRQLMVSPHFSLKKTDDLFCSSLSLLLISLGCHLLDGVTPHLFTCPTSFVHYFLKICPQFFFVRAPPPGGFHPGRTPRTLLVTPLCTLLRRLKCSTPFSTLAIYRHPGKILRTSFPENTSVGGVKHKRGSRMLGFWTY